MKTMKKAFALLLAVVMVMGLSTTAFAAGETYSITINDAVNGETYSAYKIFDATYVNDVTTGEPTKISYTISTSSEWYTVMQNYTQEVKTTDENGDETTISVNPFTFTAPAADSTVMNVTLTTYTTYVDGSEVTQTCEVDAVALAKYLNDNRTGKTAAKSGTATGNTVELDVTTSGAGYYFVDTTLGALCSLDTVTGTSVDIYEKNADPTIKKYVKEDDNNSTHTDATDTWKDYEGDQGAYAVLDVVDTVYYKLVVNTGTNTNYNNDLGTVTGVDKDYTIVDSLPDGVTYNSNSVVVKVEDTPWTENTDYTVTYNETANELTIVLKYDKALGELAENTDITITYNAKMTADDTNGVSVGDENKNTVTLTYSKQTLTDSAVFKTYQLNSDTDGDNDDEFTKVDESGNPLQGVTFVLSRAVGTTTQYAKVDDNGYLTEWVTDDTDEGIKLTTDDKGSINVKGLDAGTYILTETETLPCYNKLTDTITVVIAADGTVTYRMTSADESTATSTDFPVVNKTGTELPSTGGIGTTIFYVVGSILVLGAAVLLITKKRMSNVQ